MESSIGPKAGGGLQIQVQLQQGHKGVQSLWESSDCTCVQLLHSGPPNTVRKEHLRRANYGFLLPFWCLVQNQAERRRLKEPTDPLKAPPEAFS